MFPPFDPPQGTFHESTTVSFQGGTSNYTRATTFQYGTPSTPTRAGPLAPLTPARTPRRQKSPSNLQHIPPVKTDKIEPMLKPPTDNNLSTQTPSVPSLPTPAPSIRLPTPAPSSRSFSPIPEGPRLILFREDFTGTLERVRNQVEQSACVHLATYDEYCDFEEKLREQSESIRLNWESASGIGILSLASPVHEEAKIILNFGMTRSNYALLAPLGGPVFWTGNTKFVFADEDGNVMASFEGDEGLKHPKLELPSSIKEVLFSQSEESGHGKMKIYLVYSNGIVKSVILVIVRATPAPVRELLEIQIQKWKSLSPTDLDKGLADGLGSGIHAIDPQDDRKGFYVVKNKKLSAVLKMVTQVQLLVKQGDELVLDPQLTGKRFPLTLDDVNINPAHLQTTQYESTLRLNPNINSLTKDSTAFEFPYEELYGSIQRGLECLRAQDHLANERKKRKRAPNNEEEDDKGEDEVDEGRDTDPEGKTITRGRKNKKPKTQRKV